MINPVSQTIMEQKRYGMTNGSADTVTSNVHSRLFQQAVAKQKAARTIDYDAQDDARPQVRGRSSSLGSAQNMPRGQYGMMLEKNKRSCSAKQIKRTFNSTSEALVGVNYGHILYEKGMKQKEE